MKITPLSGNYELSGAGKKCTAAVPGDFHSALLAAGIIPDPYYGRNESDVLWVGRTDWTIRRTFVFRRGENSRTFLVLTGADTFFTASVNGKKAGTGDNMFRRWRFDVTRILQDGTNTLEIIFDSAEKKAEAAADELPYPVPCSEYPISSPHHNLVRKTQCHGGWDWGPDLMVSGIYGNIQLETYSGGYFENLTARYTQARSSHDWTVHVTAVYESFAEGGRAFTFSVSRCGSVISSIVKKFTLTAGTNVLHADITVKNPDMWHTAGELAEKGEKENTLYELSAASEDGDSVITKAVAFRTIQVDTKKGALCFIVNGRRIFAKGANWIPADALPSRQTPEKIQSLLADAVQANMNMIRVWGGGQFEHDSFYDACDRLGLLIWHDFMFACSTYPSTEAFLSSVAAELAYQIPRLQTHPSIALWCGNNENIGALTWFTESKEHRDRYIADYDRLYHGVVEKAVNEYDPDRQWWPSSPCAGKDLFADNWHSDSSGDMHFWNVWHEKKSFSEYLSIKPRFVSEFGYEAFPSLEEIKTYCPEDQMNLTSPVMEYHQRSAGGNSIILENFSRYFRFPESFADMVYLSQVQQAVAIRTAITYWRTLRPWCSGAIYWQLNDVWPDASWSGIEYSGRWKLLHYAVKDAYAPVSAVLYEKDGIINGYILNDSSETLKASLAVHLLDFSGKPVCPSKMEKLSAAPDSSTPVWSLSADRLPCAPEACFIYAELTASSAGGKTYTSCDTLFPALYKSCSLQKPDITMNAEKNSDGTFDVTLQCAKPAFFTSLGTGPVRGVFSRNMFTLLPGKPVTVTFTPKGQDISAQKLLNMTTVTSLRDTY